MQTNPQSFIRRRGPGKAGKLTEIAKQRGHSSVEEMMLQLAGEIGSTLGIAKNLDVSPNTVRTWMLKHGFQLEEELTPRFSWKKVE